MVIGSLLLLLLFVYPLWSITLGAPQYPEPLGMDIWIDQIVGSHENDIQNINLMNHYVGMDKIPEHMPEFDIFPIVIISMSVLGVIIGIVGKPWMFLTWFIAMSLLGVAGMYDFYLWEYEYGHSLDPKAAIKFMDENGEIMAYQPPLFGTKLILNFTATSLPLSGAYYMFTGMILTLIAFFTGTKEMKKKKIINNGTGALTSVALLLFLSSCSISPQPINYGKDACSYCKMNIVDKQHGAELVTKKGKVYKYDAIECMLNDIESKNESEIGLLLVNTFDVPIELKEATTATFLISEKLPSPMGAFLTAFDSKSTAKTKMDEIGGEIFKWEELKIKFKK